MFLSRVIIENFRVFGDKATASHLELELADGLNLIVGENDSGKSSFLDAIKLVLGSTTNDPARLTSDDFHITTSTHIRVKDLRIACEFSGFDDEEASALLEWLTLEKTAAGSMYKLYVTLDAQRKEVRGRFDREINVTVKAGIDDAGAALDGAAREIIRTTYLKALRDAEQELAAKRGSRLSQILMAHPLIRSQAQQNADAMKQETVATVGAEGQDNNGGEARELTAEPKILDVIKAANKSVTAHSSIKQTVADLNDKYLSKFTLGEDRFRGEVGIAEPELKRILEQLQLTLHDDIDVWTRHGLGLNNLLFIATELLLLETGATGSVPLALIEEPEAHLHPQLQIRLMEALQASNAQVIVTTHSPNLASVVDLERVIIMNKRKAFPLAAKYTQLQRADYEFLRRFLDVTKANLFFARGVLIVEGDAEHLLIPAIAAILGLSFSKFGVSVVNVGHVGLFRYSRVFQRTNDPQMDIRVACMGDRDVPPDAASGYLKSGRKVQSSFTPEELKELVDQRGARYEGGPVKAFISPHWTLEYDMTQFGLNHEVHIAVKLAAFSKKRGGGLSGDEIAATINEAETELTQWEGSGLNLEEIGCRIYEPLYRKAASKAETAQYLSWILQRDYSIQPNALRAKLPPYVIAAIDHVTGK